MPTYEYSCPTCGKFDVFQKITEDALEECPTCGEKIVRVIHGGTGIIFKGSGFYTTDYRSKKSISSSTSSTSGESAESTDSGAEKKSGDSESKAS